LAAGKSTVIVVVSDRSLAGVWKLRILVVCQHYWPEPFRLTDICEELVNRGHHVTVLTGMPNYPMGELYEGYKKSANTTEVHNGVEIIRCRTIPRKTGTFWRALNYFSYSFFASRKAKKLSADFDVVFTNQTSPVMMSYPAIVYKKKHGKKVIMYAMDLWPASLAAGGISPKSPVYKLFHKVSRYIYRRMDSILVTSSMFIHYLTEEFGINQNKLKHLPQYAEDIFTEVTTIKDNTIDLMFAGNIGTTQSVETIIKAAKLVTIPNVRWHIVGDGRELDNIKRMAEGIENVIFYGRVPLEQMPALYAKADAMLVTLMKDPVISLTLPGKVQTCMAAGKPIIAAADGETYDTITQAKCGFASPAEDAEALAGSVETFAKADANQLGENSLNYFQKHFSRNNFFEILESELNEYTVH